MKMQKRTALTMLLALVLAMLLAACGSATPAPAATTAPVAVATTAPAASTTAATVATTAPATSATTAPATTGTTAAATAGTGTATGGRTNLACTAPSAAIAANSGKTWVVGIAVQDTIPALDNAIRGVKDGMADCGFVEGKNVKYEMGNALGDLPALVTIGQKFRDLKVDLIVAVGTAALVNMYNTNPTTPIVFNSVTNPYVALKDIIKSPTEHGNITGIQAAPPVDQALKLAKDILPNAKNAGLVWTTSEVNSQVTTEQARKFAPQFGLTIVEGPITKKEDVLQASQAIADKVDFFLSTTDVSVVAALESLYQIAVQSKKPIISNDPASAPRGAMVAVGIDYYNSGINSVRAIEKILTGTPASKIDIDIEKAFEVSVNTKAAELTGVKIPDAILKQAKTTFKEVTPKT
jgi:putative tryptophan/tyrosine transport system substrate-binding protein